MDNNKASPGAGQVCTTRQIVIFIFLANIRTTLIAAIAIPTSLISTFALMAAMGFTLNQITMLALTLMVGIVIDDAIIVLENVYRFIEEKNHAADGSGLHRGDEGNWPGGDGDYAFAAGNVLFLPVGFMGGIVGRFRWLVRLHGGITRLRFRYW